MIGTKPYAKLKYREVKGRQMAYIDEGEGDAIVFQHGQPAASCVWRNVMPHLEGRCRLIACDLIGIGRSEKLSPSGPDRYRYSEHRDHFSRSGMRSISATAYCSYWTTGTLYSGLTGPDRIVIASKVSFIWKPLRPL